jgi:hypothetical protein
MITHGATAAAATTARPGTPVTAPRQTMPAGGLAGGTGTRPTGGAARDGAGTEAGQWPVVNDPRRWRRFVLQVIEAHHRVTVPGIGADQCSCGRPFMLCPIGPLAHQLLG